MRKPILFLSVGTRIYRVAEHAGSFKAHLDGYFGWTSVWADSILALEKRIRQVRSGGQ
jgi:hypothetical protein